MPPDREPATAPEGVQINPYAPDPAHYRALYRRRSASPGSGHLRLRLSDAELEALLANPDLERFTLDRDGEPVGLLELDFSVSRVLASWLIWASCRKKRGMATGGF